MPVHQISFIADGALKTFHFDGDAAMAERFRSELGDKIGRDVQDLQVYQPNFVPESVVEMITALGDDTNEKTWQHTEAGRALLARAAALDAAASAAGAAAVDLTVEFVWLNGGGDDNAYTSTVTVRRTDADLVSELVEEVIAGTPISGLTLTERCPETEPELLAPEQALAEALAAAGYADAPAP